MSGDLLLVLTKPARPGKVKTRLLGALDPGEAAALHGALVDDVCARLTGGPFAVRIAWALDGVEPVPAGPFPGLRQEGADLGERLHRALAAAAVEAPRVAAVGTDCPDLDSATVAEAFRRLEGGADVVLGPAADGGYVLIALRREAVRRELFADVPWSTSEVLATTQARARELGLAVELLPVAHDVDTPADLERLAGRIASGELAGCPRVAALLAAWGRLPAGVEATV